MSPLLPEHTGTGQVAIDSLRVGSRTLSKLFSRFWRAISPTIRQQAELGVAYEEARVLQAQADAERTIKEAAKLAAETERIKHDNTRAFFDNVDHAFGGTENECSMLLKVSKLLAGHPELTRLVHLLQNTPGPAGVEERLLPWKNGETFHPDHRSIAAPPANCEQDVGQLNPNDRHSS